MGPIQVWKAVWNKMQLDADLESEKERQMAEFIDIAVAMLDEDCSEPPFFNMLVRNFSQAVKHHLCTDACAYPH